MHTTGFAVFGQELYLEESIKAIEAFRDEPLDRHLSAKIAELLPHKSQSTRLRVATKIVQRFFKTAAFLKFINTVKSESSKHDLLYWRAARTDNIISEIAREIIYPYFVLDSIPEGYDESSFHLANTATLFVVDRVISSDFAEAYAKKIFHFDSPRTVALSLRIMKQAGILDAVTVKLGRRHVSGYYTQPHSLQPEVFAYCVYEEFGGDAISLDRLENGDCVKLFFLNRLQVESLLKSLERKKLIEYITLPGGKSIRFTSSSLDDLVSALIGN